MARLLIIDDEKAICQEFCETLKDLGHEAEFAIGGDEALRKIDSGHYDIIFLDLSMPRMSGSAVFKRILQRSKVPVAFMTGFMSPETEKEMLSLGAIRCLRKPVRLSEIVELLGQIDTFTPSAN